jgi:predicted Zn-dependent protease
LLKQNLTRSADERQWLRTAQALRSFYVTHGLLELALELDNQIHAKRGTAYSAMQLAETQLVLNRNADAEQVLSRLGPDRSTPASQALLAVAQARRGKMDEARRIVKAAASPDDKGPGTLYNFARMYAATGDTKKSLILLTSSFESTPPSTLELFKRHARKCPDFASMAESSDFQQALKTESKIHESECSSGSSCASCPMRGQCSSGADQ